MAGSGHVSVSPGRRWREVVASAGVDEKAIAKRPAYLTVEADLDQTRVLHLADERKSRGQAS